MRYIRFSNDGWYARYDDGLNETNVVRVADAAAARWADLYGGGTVHIGYDTRRDAPKLAAAAAAAVGAWGLEARLSNGPCPMPALNLVTRTDASAVGALMLTADHRNADYLGIRVRNNDSSAIGRDEAGVIEDLVSQELGDVGGPFALEETVGPFLGHMASLVDAERIRSSRLDCIVDPMYGTARSHAATLLRSLGVGVVEIHGDIVDDFGGIHPEVVEPWLDDLEYMTGQTQVDFGIAIDGPSNRAAAVDGEGHLVPAPKLHALVLLHLIKNRGLSGRIVLPRFSSVVIRRVAESLGCGVTLVPPGPTWPFEEIRQGGVITTSDGLGGICVPSCDPERNAFVTMLLLVELLAYEGASLQEMLARLDAAVGSMEYGHREVRMDPGRCAVLRNLLPGVNPEGLCDKTPVSVSHAGGLRVQYDDDSWLFIRPSMSEPLVRIYGEGIDRADRDNLLGMARSYVDSL
ncbi:phosphoglucomutase [Atopobiaceae bacterium 24-176]